MYTCGIISHCWVIFVVLFSNLLNAHLPTKAKDVKKMSIDEAIRLVQIHERARQGRLRAKFMREIRLEEEREKQAALRGAPTLDPDVAATRIQKVSNAWFIT